MVDKRQGLALFEQLCPAAAWEAEEGTLSVEATGMSGKHKVPANSRAIWVASLALGTNVINRLPLGCE